MRTHAMTRRLHTFLLVALLVGAGARATAAQELPETTALPRPAHLERAPHFERLTTRQGLSQNMVYDSVQDSLGFMWFATQDGLNRYDGKSFRTFDRVPYDSTSLLTSVVIRLHAGTSGMLWVATSAGLQRYDPATESFETMKARRPGAADTKKPDSTGFWPCVSCYGLSAMLEDKEGEVWLGSGLGFARFDPEKRSEELFTHDPDDATSLTNSIVTDIHQTADGEIWVATVNGVNRLNRKDRSFERFMFDPEYSPAGLTNMAFGDPPPARLRTNLAAAFADDVVNPGKIWVATMDGLVHLDKTSGESERYVPPRGLGGEPVFTDIEPDPETPGVYWLTTATAGLFRFDAGLGEFERFVHDPEDATSISTDRLSSIHTDASGVMWVGTWSGGVNKLDINATKFSTVSNRPGSKPRLTGSEVWSIFEDRRGRLWLGTNPGGLNVVDRVAGTVASWNSVAKTSGSPRAETQWVFAIHEDAAGTMWLGTNATGLHYRRSGWSSFRPYPHQPPGGQKWITDIFEDSRGRLWILSNRSINRVDPDSGELIQLYDNPAGGFVHNIAEGHDGTFWVAVTGGGLIHLDRHGAEIERFVSDPTDATGMLDNALLVVHPSRAEPGVIWFGTSDAGLGRFDLATRDFRFFGTNDGLANNIVYGILEDDEGMLWLSTNRGISRFVPETYAFANYGVEDGAQSEEFNANAYFRSARTGEMFFGGIAGVNAFFPDDVSPNTVAPRVAITGVRLFNEAVEPGPESPIAKQVVVADEIELDHWQKMVTFEFVALHFVDPSQNQYLYKLEGFNDDWVAASTSNTATFTNLDPGEYTFSVRAANSDGVWGDEPASIRLIINPPWWRTTWAYLLYGMMLAAAVLAVDRFMRRRVTARATGRMLEKENRRKSEELEHAREVQLSLLPQVPPQVPGVAIAAGMRTATEVGGDYYDFHVADDGTLMVAIGDATGHGLSAGTVVSATKGIFGLVGGEADIEAAMDRCAHGVRRLGLQKLFMAFALVRIVDGRLEAVGGGMPPALVFRAGSGNVEEVSLSGLPLGSPQNGQYRKTSVRLDPGDTVVLMSDGFPELANGSNEMIGYDRARKELATVGRQSADEILRHFHRVCDQWTNGTGLRDDVTFVILKKDA